MLAFFHPHNLFESLLIYAAIVVAGAIVCGSIGFVQERRKRKLDKSKIGNGSNINQKISEENL